MPVISVKLAKGRSVEQKRAFAQAVTKAAEDILSVKPAWVTELFEGLDRQNWATAGGLHADKPAG